MPLIVRRGGEAVLGAAAAAGTAMGKRNTRLAQQKAIEDGIKTAVATGIGIYVDGWKQKRAMEAQVEIMNHAAGLTEADRARQQKDRIELLNLGESYRRSEHDRERDALIGERTARLTSYDEAAAMGPEAEAAWFRRQAAEEGNNPPSGAGRGQSVDATDAALQMGRYHFAVQLAKPTDPTDAKDVERARIAQLKLGEWALAEGRSAKELADFHAAWKDEGMAEPEFELILKGKIDQAAALEGPMKPQALIRVDQVYRELTTQMAMQLGEQLQDPATSQKFIAQKADLLDRLLAKAGLTPEDYELALRPPPPQAQGGGGQGRPAPGPGRAPAPTSARDPNKLPPGAANGGQGPMPGQPGWQAPPWLTR